MYVLSVLAMVSQQWLRGRSKGDRVPSDGYQEMNNDTDGDGPTPQQLRILRLLYEGANYDVIAKAIFSSRTTVYREIRDLKERVGAPDLPHLFAEAARRGWPIQPVNGRDGEL
jgi:DNA-binding NarL/FixJ family response regulator